MFLDYSLPVNQRDSGTIRPSQYEVFLNEVPSAIKVASAVGIVFLTISGLALVSSTFGSTCCWIGSSGVLFGASCLILASLFFVFKEIEHQTRRLDTAESYESYCKILEQDKGVTYRYKVYDVLEHNTSSEDLNKQSKRDEKGRITYQVNGKEITTEVQEAFGECYKYANQSLITPMQATLMSRYENSDLNIHVSQKAALVNASNTKINLVQKSNKKYLIYTQLFQITHVIDEINYLKYIRAEMQVDLETGKGIMTWKSPQNDPPTL